MDDDEATEERERDWSNCEGEDEEEALKHLVYVLENALQE